MYLLFSNIEGDPGILIYLSSEDEIHDILGLPAVRNIPNLTIGKVNKNH